MKRNSLVTQVVWRRRVQKVLEKAPLHVVRKFYAWASEVELIGIRLYGFAQDIMTNRWRGIEWDSAPCVSIAPGESYMLKTTTVIVEVLEVINHDY